MNAPNRRRLVWLCIVTAVYYIAGRVGLSLAEIHPSASAIWAPTGIAIAAIVLGGRRMWPAVFCAAYLVNWTTSGSVLLSINIATGNTIEALLAGALLEHLANGRRCFANSLGVLQFLMFGALLPAMVCALVGTYSLVAMGFAPLAKAVPIWSTWWLGDATGALLITPVPILAARWWQEPESRWPARHFLDTALVFSGFTIAGITAFTSFSPVGIYDYPLFLLIVPLVLWSAFRLPRLETAIGILILATFAVTGTHSGLGPFARYEPNTALLLLQIFMALTTMIGLVVAAEVHDRREAEALLRQREQQYAVVVDSANDAIITVAENDKIVFANPAAAKMFGYSLKELIGMELIELMPMASRPGHLKGFHRYLETGQRTASWQNRELVARHRSGRDLPIEVSYGEHTYNGRQFTGVIRDISRRLASEAAERWLATIVADSNDAILSKDLNGKVLSWNRGAEFLFGYTAEEMIGESIIKVFPAERIPEHMDIMDRLKRGERIDHFDTQRLHKNGSLIDIEVTVSPIIDTAGRIIGASSVARNITERRRSEAAVRHLAHHDGLTGLSNRVKFREDLSTNLASAASAGHQVALLFIDLDKFKEINDTHGHECGDLVLKTVAQRLEHSVRQGDVVARLGGDEFVVLLVNGITPSVAEAVGLQLLETLRTPIKLAEREIQVGASVGLAVFPDDGHDEHSLMIAADQAMYGAKRSGRNRCLPARPGMRRTDKVDIPTEGAGNRRANISSTRIRKMEETRHGDGRPPEVPFE